MAGKHETEGTILVTFILMDNNDDVVVDITESEKLNGMTEDEIKNEIVSAVFTEEDRYKAAYTVILPKECGLVSAMRIADSPKSQFLAAKMLVNMSRDGEEIVFVDGGLHMCGADYLDYLKGKKIA